jgi:hypothetical protein
MRDARKLGIENRPKPAEEGMRHPELIQPRTLPSLPGIHGISRRTLRIPLKHDDPMTVTGQEHGGPEGYYTRPHHHDPRHGLPPSPRPAPQSEVSPAHAEATGFTPTRAPARPEDRNAASPAALASRSMDDAWRTINQIVSWLDANSILPPETEKLLRIMKLTEEAGEVTQAVIGAMG